MVKTGILQSTKNFRTKFQFSGILKVNRFTYIIQLLDFMVDREAFFEFALYMRQVVISYSVYATRLVLLPKSSPVWNIDWNSHLYVFEHADFLLGGFQFEGVPILRGTLLFIRSTRTYHRMTVDQLLRHYISKIWNFPSSKWKLARESSSI